MGEGGPGTLATPGLELPASTSTIITIAISTYGQMMECIKKMAEWRMASFTDLGSGSADRLRHLLIDQLYTLAGKEANLQDETKMIESGSALA